MREVLTGEKGNTSERDRDRKKSVHLQSWKSQ